MKHLKNKSPEKIINIRELADTTGLKVSFIRKAIRTYRLPFYKLGGGIRFRMSEVETWLKSRKGSIAS